MPDPSAEIRSRLERIKNTREHGDLEVAEIVRDAARNDRRDILRAVELDPMREHDPIVPERVVEEAVEIHARRRFPDRLGRAERRARAADWMRSNLERADEVARELAGEPLFPTDSDELRVLHDGE